MRLSDMIGALDGGVLIGDDVEVAAVSHDSRRVVAGDLFCCVPGARHDGHDHAAEAAIAGAVALLCERALEVDLPQVIVPSTRRAMGRVASRALGDPSAALMLVGITGTNGKTTTAHLLDHVLASCGLSSEVIGTLTGARTTPEAPELQRELAAARDNGRAAVVMEVSSHALDQRRVDGCRFAAVAFTNLSHDHLDHHGSLESYFEAKSRLFSRAFSDRAVINVDDEHGARLAAACGLDVVEVTLGALEDLDVQLQSSSFVWRGRHVHLPLGGELNVRNAVMAAELALLVGRDEVAVADALSGSPQLPGRFEPVSVGQEFAVIVDYAHTPDGIQQVLAATAAMTPGRVLLVFGCGGDRDPAKRPLMGEAASRADLVFVTTDNPRSESPDAIIGQILEGIDPLDEHVIVEPDRRSAIRAAIGAASAGDTVVVAGKGHETEQVFADRSEPFDDRVVTRAALEDLR